MTQNKRSINSHIEEYLNYYCNLSSAPGFAVLLKGDWGSGKTWFIKEYQKKLKEQKYKVLYVSLYGVASFSEIGNIFFQQLHPILSSKGMAITNKIFSGLVKATFKIDLNNDGQDDGSVSSQMPQLDIPYYLQKTDGTILIFDDLERCGIEIGNILGYVNTFVEHEGLKVILVANEDEISDPSGSYSRIKEKLIGKIFSVSCDFSGALQQFVSESDAETQKFLHDHTELIECIYKGTNYRNLRILKKIVLEFKRIFIGLPDKVKKQPELLCDILKLITAFSIEIQRGFIDPGDIGKCHDTAEPTLRRVRNEITPEQEERQVLLRKVHDIQTKHRISEMFPNAVWWQLFLDEGRMDSHELERSISTSQYFQDENTPK